MSLILQEYVFIENDIVFNENTTIALCLHIVFVSFDIVFSHLHEIHEND